ncbi:MAG: transposase [Bdellovibrionota bacterium]|nr:MAG: transposase [Bdellovibrionota bacterium]
MPHHPRIESVDIASFVTTKSRNAELWFVNNPELEQYILGYAAKYTQTYGVQLYALAIEGNHKHLAAHFPRANRSSFMRDLNSNVARAVARHTPEYPGGTFWGRRYSGEFLPGPADIEEYFFYIVLQPVEDGLVRRISEFPGYNCFHDAIHGIERVYKVVDWAGYNSRKRYDRSVCIRDYTTYIPLRFQRLPGYEHMSSSEYVKHMQNKLRVREDAIAAKRFADGKGFLGRKRLRRVKRGAIPKDPKISRPFNRRPRVLAVCPIRRHQYLSWYYARINAFRLASLQYRSGLIDAQFPDGMFRPHLGTAPPKPQELAVFFY